MRSSVRVFELQADSREVCAEWVKRIGELLQEGRSSERESMLRADLKDAYEFASEEIIYEGVLRKKTKLKFNDRYFVLYATKLVYYASRRDKEFDHLPRVVPQPPRARAPASAAYATVPSQ